MKWLKIILFFLFLISLLLGSFVRLITTSFSSDNKSKIIEIKEDTPASQTAEILEQNGIIHSAFIFKILIYLSKNSAKIKAGEYNFHSKENMFEVLNKIVKGEVINYMVTIPEGFTLKQIAQTLEKNKIISKKEFLNFAKNNFYKINGYTINNLEGYLFPDSYYFPKNSKANIIIETMLKRFKDQILPIYNQNKPKLKYSLKQIIILASLIEMEAYLIEEQPLIASVYYNRLKLNMFLQCDATIQYSLPEFKPYLSYKDLKINSPYNTYQNSGFPPGAIANPGERAILASFFPAKTNYLYYVRNDLKGDGSHIFSSNYAEHLAAIKKYQR